MSAGVVAAVGARELNGELVAFCQPAAPGLVPAEKRIGAGAENERVSGILAAAAEDGALHRRQDIALEGARRAEPLGLRQRVVGELGGAAHVGQLVLALHDTERGDEVRCVLQRAEVAERRLDLEAVRRREPLRVALDPDALAGAAVFGHHVAERASGIGAGLVHPDSDVLDDRGVLRLPEVRRAGEQGDPPVAAEPEALEEAEPEGVVAGEVEHALLLEEQDAGEAALLQRANGRVAAPVELGLRKVDGHGAPSAAGGARPQASQRARLALT